EKFGPLGLESRIQALEAEWLDMYVAVQEGTVIEDVLGNLFDYRVRKRGPKDWDPNRKKHPYGHDDVVRIMDRLHERAITFPAFSDLMASAGQFMSGDAVLP